jgi:hypothetical protein
MQVTLAAVCLLSSIAAWLAGATFWWLVAGIVLGAVIPIHSDRDPADKQAIVESHAGQTISPNGAATRPLGQIARREKRPQCSGTRAIAVSSDFREVLIVQC